MAGNIEYLWFWLERRVSGLILVFQYIIVNISHMGHEYIGGSTVTQTTQILLLNVGIHVYVTDIW